MGKKQANVQSAAKAHQNAQNQAIPKIVKARSKNYRKEGKSLNGITVFILVSLLSCVALTAVLYFYEVDPTSSESASRLFRKFSDQLLSLIGSADSVNSTAPASQNAATGQASKQPATEKSATEKSVNVKQASAYSKANITNSADNKIRTELDAADEVLATGDATVALELYNKLLVRYPSSPRATWGKARALSKLADRLRSNQELEQSIQTYEKLLDMKDIPKVLMLEAGRACAERQSFRGWASRSVKTFQRLLQLFPEEWQLWNEYGVQCLIQGRNEDARVAFKNVLAVQPTNGFAKVHMGFIIKSTDRDYERAVPYLREGIQSGEKGVIDGRFFFQLGDSLYRLGRKNESYEVYKDGANRGVFRSMLQRSLYNIDGLDARPWWTLDETGVGKALRKLEENWKEIRDEGLANLDHNLGVFKQEDEDLRETGDWRQLTLYQRGRRNEENCKRTPRTCALVEQITEATSCTRGQIKFSVMQPGVHVWPHCGPTNCRVRCHLGLVVPPGPRIRVGEETRGWEEGKFIVFDDSFEHEVWHDGDSVRLVLIVDIWHPQVSQHHRKTLPAI